MFFRSMSVRWGAQNKEEKYVVRCLGCESEKNQLVWMALELVKKKVVYYVKGKEKSSENASFARKKTEGCLSGH